MVPGHHLLHDVRGRVEAHRPDWRHGPLPRAARPPEERQLSRAAPLDSTIEGGVSAGAADLPAHRHTVRRAEGRFAARRFPWHRPATGPDCDRLSTHDAGGPRWPARGLVV